jgi:hypothetical protein
MNLDFSRQIFENSNIQFHEIPSSAVAYRGGFGVSTTLLPKFRSFEKAEPNSLFHGKYIPNNSFAN